MVKNYSEILHSIKKLEKISQRNRCSTYLQRTEQTVEIYGVNAINWVDSSWKHLSLIGGEEVVSLWREGERILRFCVMSWKDEREPTIKYCLGGQVDVFKSSSEYRALDTIDGEPMEFEWNISQVSPHCSPATKSKSSCQK